MTQTQEMLTIPTTLFYGHFGNLSNSFLRANSIGGILCLLDMCTYEL